MLNANIKKVRNKMNKLEDFPNLFADKLLDDKNKIIKDIEHAIYLANEHDESSITYEFKRKFSEDQLKFIVPFMESRGFEVRFYQDYYNNSFLAVAWGAYISPSFKERMKSKKNN